MVGLNIPVQGVLAQGSRLSLLRCLLESHRIPLLLFLGRILGWPRFQEVFTNVVAKRLPSRRGMPRPRYAGQSRRRADLKDRLPTSGEGCTGRCGLRQVLGATRRLL